MTRDKRHPLVASHLNKHQRHGREAALPGELSPFTEIDFVLVAHTKYGGRDKQLHHRRGTRRASKSVNDYVYQGEDLRTRQPHNIHATCLNFYHDDAIGTRAITTHVLQSEYGMRVTRLLDLAEGLGSLQVHVRWKDLGHLENSLERLK